MVAFSFWAILLWIVSVLIGLAIVPIIAIRLPHDYLVRVDRQCRVPIEPAKLCVWIARNSAGVAVVAGGCILVPFPGPGLAAILVGLALVDLPGKRAVERWLILRPSVLRMVNRLRRRAGRPPLILPVAAAMHGAAAGG